MSDFTKMSKEELEALRANLLNEYEDVKSKGISLNMARGKPGPDQLELSMPMMKVLTEDELLAADGTDCRNYGVLDGLKEAKELVAGMINTSPENLIIYGNSSLNIMYDTVSRSYTHGVLGNTPWCKLDKVKFLCPVPGYDRHFAITEHFGIEMINIPLLSDGPDMDLVEKYVSEDESVKGIWCVPKYANPTGIVYSDQVVKRFAALQPAAKDFRIYWDNAYTVHHLDYEHPAQILDILSECEKAGNPDLVYEFCSTSKVTFPGSGVAALATSKANIADVKKSMTIQTIGHDKINQLRHVKFFKDINGINQHMEAQAKVLCPKFQAVLDVLEEKLAPCNIASWNQPKGGYFISLETIDGCAKKAISMCKDAGLVLTGAGATYPYHKDPKDSNIRIAPSFPLPEELREAAKILVLCVKIAAIDVLLNK